MESDACPAPSDAFHDPAAREIEACKAKAAILFKETPASLMLTSELDGRILEVNDTFIRLSGFARDEVVGRRYEELDLLRNPEDALRILRHVDRLGAVRNEEVEWRSRDGTILTGLTSAIRIDLGQGPCILSLTADITERKRAEQELRQAKHEVERANERIRELNRRLQESLAESRELAAAARAASRSRNEFFASMSHELLTPMNGVLGMTELLLGAVPTGEQREQLEAVRSSGLEMLRMVNSLLQYSKSEAVKAAEESRPIGRVDLPDELLEPVDAARRRDEAVPVSQGRVLLVTSDDAMREEVSRLLRSRELDMRVVRTGVQALEQADHAAWTGASVRLAVVDAALPDLAGEALVARMRERHPGLAAIVVTSESPPRSPATGSPRTLFVPRTVSPADLSSAMLLALRDDVSQEAPAPPNSQRRLLHVLVVDDNAVNQKVIAGMLQRQGHSTVAVGNGEQAVSAHATGRFDLVLMDVQMPVMDGFAASRAIRKREAETGGHVPILALTAHSLDGDRERCLEAGMDGHVAKPVRPQELIEQVQRATSQPQVLGARAEGAPGDGCADDALTLEQVLRRLEADEALVASVIDLFFANRAPMLDAIRGAVGRSDAAALERAAHALKNTVGNFQTGAAWRAAARLECIGREGRVEEAPAALEILERHARCLSSALDRIRREVAL